MTSIDVSLQEQVDAQLAEQGAFAPLELLIGSGRLIYSDYESWRRREIELLDDVLMGSKEKILAQLEAAAGYARAIGLVEQQQEFYAWGASAQAGGDRPLRISADPRLHRLIASRYTPAQSSPQMDLFFDNPIVTLTNGLVRALSAGNTAEGHRLLDRLYAQAPNHADLAAFDRLLTAAERSARPVDDPRQEMDFLLDLTPTARRLLGSQARDLLAPLWRRIADALGREPFDPDSPSRHRSFALQQAQDWPGVASSVLDEHEWWRHAALCLRLAESAFYRRRRIEALTAWCHLCWRAPGQAAAALGERRQPDSGLAELWRRFLDSEADFACDDSSCEPALTAEDFPAWLLLREPDLADKLPLDLPVGDTAGEASYRRVHRWIHARRASRHDEEMALRRELKDAHPALFRCLKQSV